MLVLEYRFYKNIYDEYTNNTYTDEERIDGASCWGITDTDNNKFYPFGDNKETCEEIRQKLISGYYKIETFSYWEFSNEPQVSNSEPEVTIKIDVQVRGRKFKEL